ncbi:hypothetical protein M9H77_23793 [Catharanthus roseus]|uniref:Uncharacterized protein n=1 Tax=Catharanthus roseus TaxID=4058 RepID=A0ACC0AVT9_CATRO|nr:hypothetical protein M9H77_23793 [Catharanthus roseus]
MEAIGRQEMTCSKLARARSNCYEDGNYRGNAYGGSHHRDGHSTHRSQMGIGNFSSRAKAFDHIPYEDCENSPYDVHKGYHGSHDYRDQNCDSLRVLKFWRQSMENEGKMDYYFYDIISFPAPPSHSCFGHFCKEAKYCSYVLDLDRNSLQHACTLTLMSGRRYTMEFKGQGKNVGGKLLLCYGDSSMSIFSNLFLFYLVFSFKELKLFSYGTHLLVVQDSFHDSLVFIAHDVEPWNICDSLGDANHCTFSFLGNNSYGFDGSLFSLLGIEDQRKGGGKELLLSQANSSISFRTNSSPSYFEFYFKELKLFLNAYAFHEIIVGALCTIF